MPTAYGKYVAAAEKLNRDYGVHFDIQNYEVQQKRMNHMASFFLASKTKPENLVYSSTLLNLFREAVDNKIEKKNDKEVDQTGLFNDFESMMEHYRAHCAEIGQTPPSKNGGWKSGVDIAESMRKKIADIKSDKSDYAKDKYLAGKLPLRAMRANLETMRTEGMTAERLSNTIVHARALEKVVRERSGWWKVMPWNWARNRAEQKELRSLNEFLEAAQTENPDLCQQATAFATENVIDGVNRSLDVSAEKARFNENLIRTEKELNKVYNVKEAAAPQKAPEGKRMVNKNLLRVGYIPKPGKLDKDLEELQKVQSYLNTFKSDYKEGLLQDYTSEKGETFRMLDYELLSQVVDNNIQKIQDVQDSDPERTSANIKSFVEGNQTWENRNRQIIEDIDVQRQERADYRGGENEPLEEYELPNVFLPEEPVEKESMDMSFLKENVNQQDLSNTQQIEALNKKKGITK